MISLKAGKDSPTDGMQRKKYFVERLKFGEKLVKSGVMLTGERFLLSSKGARVKFSDGKHTVTDGPFAETKELL